MYQYLADMWNYVIFQMQDSSIIRCDCCWIVSMIEQSDALKCHSAFLNEKTHTHTPQVSRSPLDLPESTQDAGNLAKPSFV